MLAPYWRTTIHNNFHWTIDAYFSFNNMQKIIKIMYFLSNVGGTFFSRGYLTLFSTTAETFFFLSQATGWLFKVREQHCIGEANSIHDLSWAKWRNPDKNMFLNSLERSNTDTSVKKEICTPSSRSWTSDLWISWPLYSPPLYQLSYRRCHKSDLSCGELKKIW